MSISSEAIKDIVKILVKEHASLSAKTFGLGVKKIYITYLENPDSHQRNGNSCGPESSLKFGS